MPPVRNRRRRLTAEARREQLLDVTTRIVVDHGFRTVSIEAVARGAGVSRALVYEHFGQLETLLEAVIERELARALSQVTETELTNLSEGEPSELMLDSLRAYLYAVRDHPLTWRLVLMPPQGAPALLHRRIARGRARILDRLAQAVRPALAGEDDPPDAELTAHLLSAISDEYARLVLTDPAHYSPERLLEHARWCIAQVSIDGVIDSRTRRMR